MKDSEIKDLIETRIQEVQKVSLERIMDLERKIKRDSYIDSKFRECFRVHNCPKCKHITYQHRDLAYINPSSLMNQYTDWKCLTCGSKLKEETITMVINEKE